MTEAAKEIRRAYYREYYRQNPDKRREANRRYWERKAEEAQQKKDYEEKDVNKHDD